VALIANASVSARRSLGQALEQSEWRVVEARDGLEAWELLESAAPELLIIDLELPVLDAFSVIRAAKSQSDLSVIVLAAASDPQTQAQIMEAGVDLLLTKPVEPEHLLASLSALGHGAARVS
jgi:DNA-binding response OmpR family regulator